MSTYVIADIHGCYDEFQQMLNKINFNPEVDELIIAGDIVDRGPQSYEMLEYARSEPKGIKFIKGNHDVDFARYCSKIFNNAYSTSAILQFEDVWNSNVYDYYGTVEKLVNEHELNAADFQLWNKMISHMPYYFDIEVNGKEFIIVHGGFILPKDFTTFTGEKPFDYLAENIEDFYVWAREEGIKYGGKPNATVIFGHTPTIFKEEMFYNKGKVCTLYNERNCRFINIDCGLVYGKNYPDDEEGRNGNLACIRLEDEKIFYLYE
jgi:serine/threonine protein phosphatase 1